MPTMAANATVPSFAADELMERSYRLTEAGARQDHQETEPTFG
jgi:hypothetical protein